MFKVAKEDASKQQDKQVNETGVPSLTKEAKGGKQSTSYVKSRVGVVTSGGMDKYNTGPRDTGASDLFVDVPLNSSQLKAAVSGDEDFEKIDTSDHSHEGQSYSAYNGQPDHVRKYPKGFGKRNDEE